MFMFVHRTVNNSGLIVYKNVIWGLMWVEMGSIVNSVEESG